MTTETFKIITNNFWNEPISPVPESLLSPSLNVLKLVFLKLFCPAFNIITWDQGKTELQRSLGNY